MNDEDTRPLKRARIVISDCHLSAGRFYNGRLNPHEDFHFDAEMADLVEHFSAGIYASTEVELFIAGDFFDFLNVPSPDGDFIDEVDEKVAVEKVRAVLQGHPQVNAAFRKFVAQPGKTITYLIGNHDADLVFEGVRREIIQAWDPEALYPSDRVKIIHDTDRVTYEDERVQIHHGNQYEAASLMDFEEPFWESRGRKLIKLPWSSIFVTKIINRLKWERPWLDKVRPVKAFILFGLIFDTWFTLKFSLLTIYYWIRTWLSARLPKQRSEWRESWTRVRTESAAFSDNEAPARALLENQPDIQTVIMGHTHLPVNKIYPDGKQYINTGTWTRMINLYWSSLGQQVMRTFALIHVYEGADGLETECELRQWMGEHGPHLLIYQ